MARVLLFTYTHMRIHKHANLQTTYYAELLLILRVQNVTKNATSAMKGWVGRTDGVLTDPAHVGKLVQTLSNATVPGDDGRLHPIWEDVFWHASGAGHEGGARAEAVVQVSVCLSVFYMTVCLSVCLSSTCLSVCVVRMGRRENIYSHTS